MIFSDATLQRVLGRQNHALLSDLIHSLSAVVVVGSWVFIGAIVLRLAGQTVYFPGGSDFTIFYYTSRMMLEGVSPYAELPAHFGLDWQASHLGNLNPPHFQLLIVPLGLLPYSVAAAVWLLASYGSAFAVMRLAGRLVAGPWTIRRALIWGAASIANVGFLSNAVTAEWTWFLAWPMLFAWMAARRGDWTRAGLWLGLCASFKLFLLLFLPVLLLWSRWRAAVGMLFTTALGIGAGLVIWGQHVSYEWLEMMTRADWGWLGMNLSWHGAMLRMFTPTRDFVHVEVPTWAIHGLTLAGIVVIVSGFLCRLWHRRSSQDADWVFAVTLIAALLLSPLGWVYYLPLSLPAMLSFLARGAWSAMSASGRAFLVAGASGFYLPLEFTRTAAAAPVGSLVFGSIYCYAALALLAALLMARPLTPQTQSDR